VGRRRGKWSLGLDSGCVKGGELSAAVVDLHRGRGRITVESVGCKDHTGGK
jgi:hypothetical protein